jgi:hypothetical protein
MGTRQVPRILAHGVLSPYCGAAKKFFRQSGSSSQFAYGVGSMVKSLALSLAIGLSACALVACSGRLAGRSGDVSVSPTHGGSVVLGGARLSVPPDAVSGQGSLVASAGGGAPPATRLTGTGAARLMAASAPVHFVLKGARIVRPVRITFRMPSLRLPSVLPAASRASAVWLAYYDPGRQQWQPVASSFDPATRTVTALARHLSWWAPWTWDWAGSALRVRQALSAFGSGRARPASCPGVPQVTLTNAGGQDPPLIGCAAAAGAAALTVSLTNNRGLTLVLSRVPPDATPGPASYSGTAAFLTDHAFRDAFARRLGGALLPPGETLPYSVPLHGPPESFAASITVNSYLLDLALVAGEQGFGGLTDHYLTCLLDTVLRSQVPSLADLPGLATECLPVLAETSPTIQAIAKILGKRFLALIYGIILDVKLVLQTSDIAYDQYRLIQGQVTVSRPAAPLAPSADVCTTPALTCTGSNSSGMTSEPTQIVTTADGSIYVKDISWSGWGTTTATGTGTLEVNNCNPSCATGTYMGYPATVTLSALVTYGANRNAYSTMVISAPSAPTTQTQSFSTGLVP